MVGGAWPFLVGGVICLVNSVNERDLGVLARRLYFTLFAFDLCMGFVQERRRDSLRRTYLHLVFAFQTIVVIER